MLAFEAQETLVTVMLVNVLLEIVKVTDFSIQLSVDLFLKRSRISSSFFSFRISSR